MNYTDEQTPLISSNRESVSSNHLGRNSRRFYSSDLDSLDDLLTRPQRLTQPLQQSLERARCFHSAHAVALRHCVVLLLACLLLLGNYYCYDIPAALNSQLKEWLGTDYATHQYHLNLLYSVYSFPNVVLPLLGGLLIDRLSASRMLILFSLCVFVGQGIFAIGVSVKSIWVMVLGRFVFGVGSGCLEVAQAKITTDWFKARWLGLALGLNLSFARIATAMNDILSPRIAVRGGGVIAASWTGFAICALSLFCSGFLAHLDRPESRRSAGVRVDAGDRKNDQIRSRKDNIVGRSAIGVSSDSTMTMSSLALEEEDDLERDNEMAEDDQMVYSKTFTLEARFWILCLCCISLYGAVAPFIHVSSDFLQKKWYPDNPTKAGAIMSIPDIVSSVGSPLCGYIVDRLGHRARYIPVAALLLIWAHVQLGFTHITPIMAMCILGLAYSLFASVIWPCIPFLVQDHQLGTAYGLVIIALNISLTVFPMIVASILYATHGSYSHIERLFVGLAVIGLILSILLNVLDQRRGRHSQLIEDSSPMDQYHNEADDDYLDIEESLGHDRQRDRLNQQYYHGSLGHDDPRQPGFEHRRQCRFPEETMLLQDEDFNMQEVQDMVTTKSVGEGIVTIIPHSRRYSRAGAGHIERTRSRHHAQRVIAAPHLSAVPECMPPASSPNLSSRPRLPSRR